MVFLLIIRTRLRGLRFQIHTACSFKFLSVLQGHNVLHKRAGQPKRAGHLTELG
jgi:hypothetical protein